VAIPDEVIEQLKARLDIVQVVSEYLTLKKTGRNFRGLCPFHPDSDPSLVVSPERQTFHCFGCGEGGGAIHFIMRITGMGFPEAVRYLADKVGIEVPETPGRAKARSERDRLFSVNNEAQIYFTSMLSNKKTGKAAADYLHKRGIEQDLIKTYGLGYALDRWDGLARHLVDKKVPIKPAERLGLVGESQRGNLVDKFRNRITIPIRDLQGRVVGFGGRALGADEPKYLNSPDSDLYHKSRILFGLDSAREHIRGKGRAIVVEGYFDALALAAKGIGEVVATCGTALTEDHSRLLRRYTDKIILLFDGDAAGRRAAWRAMELFLDQPVQPYVVLLPEGHDPDSFVREHGPKRLGELVDDAAPILERFISNRVREAGTSIEDKVQASQKIGQVLAKVRDSTRQELLVRMAAGELEVAESAIWEQVNAQKPEDRRPGRGSDTVIQRVHSETPSEEALILALVVRHPALIEEICEAGLIELIVDPVIKRALISLAENIEHSVDGAIEDFISYSDDTELAQVLSEAIHRDLAMDAVLAGSAFSDCVRKIRLNNLKSRARVIAADLTKAQGDEEKERELLKRKRDVDQRIREIESGEINTYSE